MPGVYGFVRASSESSLLQRMSDAMQHGTHLRKDADTRLDDIEACRVYLPSTRMLSSAADTDGVSVWVEGEVFNARELRALFSLDNRSFDRNLAVAYKTGRLDDFLRMVDGEFCAVIYDKKKRTISLVSDRYGMRLLYYYFRAGRFAWASEVKALTALDFVEKRIDRASIECFLDLGYLLSEHTWLEDVKLMPPAAIVEFDITTASLSRHEYWSWSNIRQQSVEFNDAVEEVSRRLWNAVLSRYSPDDEIGISVSGGLDSRAILGIVSSIDPHYAGYAYTFGPPDCADVQIAAQVVAQTRWRHEIFPLEEDHWYDRRIDRVWQTDGMLNLMHMHGGDCLDAIKQHMAVNLNGYAGDVVLGGGFLKVVPPNARIDRITATRFYRSHVDLVDIDARFYDIPHGEPAIYMSRVRRFTNMGIADGLQKVEQRKPFFANDLIEFVFSIDDTYRQDNKLYAAALLKTMPSFFKSIPWQKTGTTIDKTPTRFEQLRRRAVRTLGRVGLIRDTHEYTNYAKRIRHPVVADKLKGLLRREGSVYSNFIARDLYSEYLRPHLCQRRINYSTKILAAATMELYFRRLFK